MYVIVSKIGMYGFWYEYVKLKRKEKTELCYMDIGNFTTYIKAEHIYVDIAKDVGRRSDTWNYELDGPLPKEKVKKGYWINETWIT